MSSLIFPTSATLPGIEIKMMREEIFKVWVSEVLGGKELRSTWWSYPRYKYTLGFELIRTAAAYLEFQKLVGFIGRHLGPWDSFLYTDPEDNTVAAHYFGVGNGVTTSFQLQRTYVADADLAAAAARSYWPTVGDAYAPVFELNGAPTIYVNGVLKATPADYTIGAGSAGGIVTFAVAPANALPLSWTGSFYRRVRVATDMVPAERIAQAMWTMRSLQLISVKP